MRSILTETQERLLEQSSGDGSRITAIRLTPYYTVVEVDGTSVGAAMSYYRLPLPAHADIQAALESRCARDPLLSGWLLHDDALEHSRGEPGAQLALVRTAVQAALVSALSTPWLVLGGDSTFSVDPPSAPHPFEGVERAVVVGLGGYAAVLARAPHVRRLHVCDLSYWRRRDEMDRFADRWQRDQPDKTVTVSDGTDLDDRVAGVDAVAITGSALANGTMEALLSRLPGVPLVVVQGQSAAIHPLSLFRRGVHLVQTTMKPRALVELAALEPTGVRMQPLLDGPGLPWIELRPSPVVTAN